MEERGEKALRSFYDDFRRALLMHRKGRLRLFFKLLFRNDESPLDLEVSVLEQLDFRVWLNVDPASLEAQHQLYLELTRQQDNLLLLVTEALESADKAQFTSSQFYTIAQSMTDIDRLANRLVSSCTNALTDVDKLTGLLNRAAMERDLAQESKLLSDVSLPFTIAMVDLDNFKLVNDQYGHPTGDLVLQIMAERFSESLRPGDRVYRYGGEEFLVLLPKTSLNNALPVLERLRSKAASSPVHDGPIKLTQTVSIGVAQSNVAESYAQTIQSADKALYEAKKAGRNQVMSERIG
jgi:diguanylate cyclase